MPDGPIERLILPRHMRPRHATLGSEALIYFERITDGRLIVPPVSWAPEPECRLPKPHDIGSENCMCGYVKREANSVRQLEQISKRYEAQKQSEFSRIDEVHQKRISAKMAEVRSRLHVAMKNAKTNFEKDFIRGALKKLEEGEKNWGPRRIEGHFQIESTEAKRG